MGRHGLCDSSDIEDTLQFGRWRGAVASAIRGRRGQQFLRELLTALDALPLPRLIAKDLQNDHGETCALGSVGKCRGLNMSEIDIEDYGQVAQEFDLNEKLAQEVMFVNDEWGYGGNTVPAMERRFKVVREWALSNIRSKGQLVVASSESEASPS
jgi:hypothetical protein